MRIVIVGGGASGVFAALQCRACNSDAAITIVEKSARLLEKVRLSGGGRCNLTHKCGDLAEFTAQYPRGRHFLRSAFSRFGPHDTLTWFKSRGVDVKAEPDGRIFPASGRSETVVTCLIEELHRAGVTVRSGHGVCAVRMSTPPGVFTCALDDGSEMEGDRLCIATGGNRDGRDALMYTELGHRIVEPIPSLFTFVIADRRLASIPGISVDDTEVSIPKTRFSERGPLLITHRGVSGPAVLRLSAFAARYLHERDYRADLHVNWRPAYSHPELLERVRALRATDARSPVFARPPVPLPLRLWQSLAAAAGCDESQRRSDLTKQQAHDLAGLLHGSVFSMSGMDTNKTEFVTCGGIALGDIGPLSMESRVCDGLYFCGEVMDIDGVTGGFNLQAAWTTGWIAGSGMGKSVDYDAPVGPPGS